MNGTIRECDFCHKDVIIPDDYVMGKGHGIDILRPFQISFQAFLKNIKKKGSDIQICKSCAEKMANYVEQVMCQNKPKPEHKPYDNVTEDVPVFPQSLTGDPPHFHIPTMGSNKV